MSATMICWILSSGQPTRRRFSRYARYSGVSTSCQLNFFAAGVGAAATTAAGAGLVVIGTGLTATGLIALVAILAVLLVLSEMWPATIFGWRWVDRNR